MKNAVKSLAKSLGYEMPELPYNEVAEMQHIIDRPIPPRNLIFVPGHVSSKSLFGLRAHYVAKLVAMAKNCLSPL